jgi:hypothetical protein
VKVGKREENEAKRGKGRKKEKLGAEKERRRSNSTFILFHQSLPPLE